MYKILEFKNNQLKIKNKETKEITVLSSIEQIGDFIKQNSKDVSVDFELQILKFVEKDESYSDVFKVLLPRIVKMSAFLSQKDIYKFIEKNIDFLDVEDFRKIVFKLETSNMLKFYKSYKDSLSKSFQVIIVAGLDDEKMILDYIKQNPDIKKEEKITLLKKLSFNELDKLYNSNEYDIQNLISLKRLVWIAPKEEREKVVNRYLEKLSVKQLDEIVNVDRLLEMKTVIKILDKNQDKLNQEQICFLIYNSEPKVQEKYYEKFENRLDNVYKHILLSVLNKRQEENFKLNDKLEEIEVSDEIKDISEKILKNFGFVASINPSVIDLLSQNGLSCFSGDDIYQLFKYCIYTDTLPDISKALDNQELFNQFQAFRKENISQNLLQAVNIENALIEFNKYYNLIEECINGVMTEQEKSILISALSDKNIDVEDKQDLQNYTAKRSEYIDKLAETNLNAAIIYMFTGLELEDYLQKDSIFFRDDQLSITLDDFSQELQEEISLMKLSKELISIIQNESEENQSRILQIFKNDLEQEFTQQGSHMSDFRNAFVEFENNLRTLYGKELQEGLLNTELPKPEQNNDVNIIPLNGEDFKLLVHGLNAYGEGSQNYEHRDVGKAYICTSLISNNCISRADAEVYYGFKNISSTSLALEGPADIYSSAEENSLDIFAERNTMFLKSDELLKQTNQKGSYNEVVLFRDQIDKFGHVKPLMPDYIVAFGKTTDKDYAEAKRLKIPIVLINEEIYERQIQERMNDKQKQIVEGAQEQIKSDQYLQKREEMLHIIEQARYKCAAIQQELIMSEINKEFKLSKMNKVNNERELDKEEGYSV